MKITLNLAREVFKKISEEKINRIKEIKEPGKVNRTFLILTINNKIILRLNNQKEEFEKEKWCIDKAKKKGVLVPNILKVGNFKGVKYLAYNFIEGKSGNEIKNKIQVYKTLGKYTRKINSIKLNGYGDKFSPEKKTFEGSWKEFINYNIESLNETDRLLKLKVYGKEQLPTIKKYFLSLKEKKLKISLVHNDLSLKNIVVDKTGKVSLIDWGSAEANVVPHTEFVEILGAGHLDLKTPTTEEINSFLKGYGISKKQFKLLEKEISKFLLLVAFDKLRWAIDKNPLKIKEYSQRARRRLEYALKVNKLK